MIPFIDDPAQQLEPQGAAWIGIVVPGLVLLVSCAVSFYLYWYFVKRV